MNRPRPARTLAIGPLESLDQRLVPSGFGAASVASNEAIVAAKGGQALGAIYQEYVNYQQTGGTFSSPEASRIFIKGTSVEVDVRFSGGNFKSLVGQMQALGMQVTATAPRVGVVEGYLPIAQLPTVAAYPNEASLGPVYKPVALPSPVHRPVAAFSVDPSVTIVTQKGGQALGSIYQKYLNYEKAGGTGTFNPVEAKQIALRGTMVGVDLRVSGNINDSIATFKGLGMQVTATAKAGQVGIIEGFLPIAQLPTVAGDAFLVGMSPMYKATPFGGRRF